MEPPTMEFNGDRKALQTALGLILRTIKRKGTSRVHFHRPRSGGVVLLYGDDDLYLRLPLPGDLFGPTRGHTDITVSAPALRRGLTRLDSTGTTIGAGPQGVFLDGLPLHPVLPERSPDFPRFRASSRMLLDVGDFRRMLREVVPAISTDTSRYGLNGVHIEQCGPHLRMVTTDGHRLSWSEAPVSGKVAMPEHMLLSPTAARLLHRLIPANLPGELRIEFSADHVRVLAGSVVLVAALTPGQFPDYRNLMSASCDRQLIVDARPLRSAVARLRPITRHQQNLVLQFEPDQLILHAHHESIGQAEESIEGELHGEPLTIGMNQDYLMDVLRASPGKRLSLSLNGPLTPCSITVAGRQDCRFIIMPVRL